MVQDVKVVVATCELGASVYQFARGGCRTGRGVVSARDFVLFCSFEFCSFEQIRNIWASL
jgi:hypothetical protein